jgi:DNA sulfur modification protein DndC
LEHRLNKEKWDLLQALYEDNLHLELMAKLLSTERQFHIMSRRAGLYEALVVRQDRFEG